MWKVTDPAQELLVLGCRADFSLYTYNGCITMHFINTYDFLDSRYFVELACYKMALL